MNRETFERQRAFAGELKPSMKRRSLDHDYHSRHIYMITLAVEGRRPLLGRLVGDVTAERGTADYPHVEPTPLGAAVMDVWNTIPTYHPGVELIAFQLMPDHIHGILFVTRYLPEGLGKVVLGFKQACNREYRRLVLDVAVAQQQTVQSQQQTGQAQQQTGQAQQQTGQAQQQTGQAQQQTVQSQQQTPQQQPLDRYHGLLFERGYNDSILLREGQLENMKRYLVDNPFRLAMKRARPEFLRVRLDVNVCGSICSAVGNLSLLSAPRKLRVRISRSIDPALLECEKESLLAAAREGAVLVSPAISPGEKAITRAAFDEGLPLITLLDNGLDPMSKPSGERFRACAEGRLLLLSPFPHRNNHITISRATCETLNALAWDICKDLV
jgi:REP element-mobilizing transposase RayT